MGDVIDVQGVRKTYSRKVVALDDVSFSVQPGEIVGILGPNGAGKSTLLRILTTLTRASKGSVRVLGNDVRASAAAARRVVGYVSQSSNFGDFETPRSTLEFYGALFRVPHAVRVRRQTELLRIFGLEEAASRPVRKLSGGMRRRVDLAAALIHEPKLVIMDEPTAGLDPASRHDLWATITKLIETTGATVLFTTHYLDEADRYSQRVLIIDHGKIIAAGTPKDLKAQFRGDRVLVRLAEPVDAERARNAVAHLPAVREVLIHEGLLTALVAEARTDTWALLDALNKAGFTILGVEFRQPSLDDVYLKATGRPFAGAGRSAA